jgi:hypothetical protein
MGAVSRSSTGTSAKQRLVGAGDAHRDRLGLVLDGVDGPGELLDGPGERRGEVVEHHAGVPTLPNSSW